MKYVYEIRDFLKQFGIFVYTGDRITDLEFMRFELKELHDLGLIDPKEYQTAILILKREERLEKERKEKKHET